MKRLFASLVFMVYLGGCAMLTEDRFVVKPSALDYAQFRTSRPSPVDGKPEVIRLDLSGIGYLEMTRGRSERIGDGFWKPSENPDWQDLQRSHVMLDEADTVAVFQKLVNAGHFDRGPTGKRHPPPHDLAVLLAIGFKKGVVLTSRADYVDLFNDLLERVQADNR